MAGTDTIPELEYQKPDGSLLTRLEMEQQMRSVWPKIHWIRIKANKIYGLPKQAAFDMREVVLRHWTLDEMTRRGQVVGDIAGVDAQTYNDDAVTRQFIQRLQYLIQTGQAITPQEGEGIDMSNFVPPPPPMGAPNMGPPNGQPQQMAFQPPVQGPPQGYAPPMPGAMPPTAPPQPQMPAAPPHGFAPPAQPQGYAPPMPGAGMPQMPQTPVPPMPGAPPQQQAAPAQGGGRRKRGGGDAAPQQAAPVPPMPSGPPGAPPQNFAPQGPPQGPQGFAPPPPQGFAPQPPQGFAPQPPPAAPQMQAQAPAEDPATQKKLDQILANQNQIIAGQSKLVQEWAILQAGLATWLRATYQRPGAPDLKATLTELGIQFPQ